MRTSALLAQSEMAAHAFVLCGIERAEHEATEIFRDVVARRHVVTPSSSSARRRFSNA